MLRLLLLYLAVAAAAAQIADPAHPPVGIKPSRPVNFHPRPPLYSTEELWRYETPKVEAFAARTWTELVQSFERGPYRPTWDSLSAHRCPEWFQDAKLGLFVDYGPWSVAGYAPFAGAGAVYPDWYELRLGHEWKAYHAETWGADVTADDLADLMGARKFDTKAFCEIARAGGMKYVVPFLKHHGGFCLWDSSVTRRDAIDRGLGRDFAVEFARDCRAAGLKFGTYVSLGEWAYPAIDGNRLRKFGFGGKIVGDLTPGEPFIAGKVPVRDYARDYLVPQCKELIEKTNPDLLWYDGEWDAPAETWRAPEINAWYYNRAAQRGQEVAINDRSGKGCRGTPGRSDFMCSEHHSLDPGAQQPWEECRGIGHSFGYNWQEAFDDKYVLSERELIGMVIDIVGRGGNLLLVINPDGSGVIPPNQERRIRALGQWLKANGPAIYATRALSLPAQPAWGRITRSKAGDRLYLLVTRLPADKQLAVPVKAAGIGRARLLSGAPVPLTAGADGFGVDLSKLPATAFDSAATVVEVEVRGPLVGTLPAVAPAADGSYALSSANGTPSTTGGRPTDLKINGDPPKFGYWAGLDNQITWRLSGAPGRYRVVVTYAADNDWKGRAVVTVGGRALPFAVTGTGGTTVTRAVDLGTVELESGATLVVRGTEKQSPYLMDVYGVKLVPVR